MAVAERIKTRRVELGISQTELAEKVGISKQLMYKYENGVITNIPSDKLERLSAALNVSPTYLMGWDDEPDSDLTQWPKNLVQMPPMKTLPLIGTIACGVPILAVENVEEEVEAPEHIRADFALRCRGDSMIGAPSIR